MGVTRFPKASYFTTLESTLKERLVASSAVFIGTIVNEDFNIMFEGPTVMSIKDTIEFSGNTVPLAILNLSVELVSFTIVTPG